MVADTAPASTRPKIVVNEYKETCLRDSQVKLLPYVCEAQSLKVPVPNEVEEVKEGRQTPLKTGTTNYQ